jgi:predicted transglutaminase-like cysteine proteinase
MITAPSSTGRIVALLAAALAVLSATPASASRPDLFIALAQPITPPRGFAVMCETRPDLCSNQPWTGETEITDDLRLLDQVNRTVNRHVRQESDLRAYGRAEVWTPSGRGRRAVGDCEDIALEKRLELIKAGFPPDNLFLAVGYARRIGLHVVLVARTGSGDLVLDSRAAGIRMWRDVPYSWIGAQSGQDPARWFGIQRSS